MNRSEAQRMRREREREERRRAAYRLRENRKASRAETNGAVLGPSESRGRAQNSVYLVRGQTLDTTIASLGWKYGSEMVCLLCRRVSGTPSGHQAHFRLAHLDCGVESKMRGDRYYEGQGLVADIRPGQINAWRPVGH